MRWLLAFAAVLLLAACGAATPEQAGAPVVPDTPAPPITAVNEAPPEDVAWFRTLRQQTSCAIAMGELFVNRNEWVFLVA